MNDNDEQIFNLLKNEDDHSIENMAILLLGLPPTHITHLITDDEYTLATMPEWEEPATSSYILIESKRHLSHVNQVFNKFQNEEVLHEKHQLFTTLVRQLVNATTKGEVERYIPPAFTDKMIEVLLAQKATSNTRITVNSVRKWVKHTGLKTNFFDHTQDIESIKSGSAEKADSPATSNKTTPRSNKPKSYHNQAIEAAFNTLGKNANNSQIYDWIKCHSENPSKEHEGFLMYLEFEGDDIDVFSVTNQKSTILKSNSKPVTKQGFQDICSKIRNNS
ncbi:hypothetical protein THIOSC13_650004 [uncultured Thiomicrorhabdus sp.]